jgi:hypothetical protein
VKGSIPLHEFNWKKEVLQASELLLSLVLSLVLWIVRLLRG